MSDYSSYHVFVEFKEWKCDFEQSQNSNYSKSTGSKENGNHEAKTTYYYCNRTGEYSAKGKGKRSLKSQGTCKIDGHCTSAIQLIENSVNEECNVFVCKTHYGHNPQLGHIRLSKQDKTLIASKRKMGIEKERILKDIQQDIGM